MCSLATGAKKKRLLDVYLLRYKSIRTYEKQKQKNETYIPF